VTVVSRVLFVCLHNAGRSKMSQAFFERMAVGSTTQSRPAQRRRSACTPKSCR
jgi:protein-tyrosine-phosphatase